MISFLTGKIESLEIDSIIINVNGIGYLVQVPSVEKFNINKSPQIIYTYLFVREDRMILYGFPNISERDFFKTLIDTPGIGPRTALRIISDMKPENFQSAVISEDLETISSIPGIGTKLAKKIVLELKEKFKKLKFDEIVLEQESKKDFVFEGIEVLKSLGYQEKEAREKILKALKNISEQNSIKIEELIKEALKK